MPGSYKVYISSTYKDLKEQREAAAKAVRALGLQTVAMEDYTSTEQKPVDKCIADVKSCDIYVGIFAFRYGHIPEGYDRSITHLEYEAAGEAGIERLIFLLDEDADWKISKLDPDLSRIKSFRELLQKHHTITLILDVHQLQAKVDEALHHAIGRLDAKKTEVKVERSQLPDYFLDILCNMNNRSSQQRELEKFLCQCEGTLNQKPFVGIIHGDEHENHYRLIQKLKQEPFLPKLLNLPPSQNSIKEYLIVWPDPSLSVKQRLESLKNNLSQELLIKRNSTLDEIVRVLNSHLTPVFIISLIQAGIWNKHEQELIENWIRFWDELPDLAIGKKVLVFLCFKYKNIEEMESSSEAKKYARLNREMRTHIENLDLKKFANINGLILPELCRVRYEDLDECITKCAAVYCDAELLHYKIDQYYKRQGMNAICMCLLVKELKELCRQTLKTGV